MKKKIVILGGGESGVGAALLAIYLGYEVFLSDGGSLGENFRDDLLENEIPFEEGHHSQEKIFEASMIIKSPGIPEKNELVKELTVKQQQHLSFIISANMPAKIAQWLEISGFLLQDKLLNNPKIFI